MVALDFVSLLLSKDLPKPASSTMSATLKQAAPSGSMGYSKWQMPPLDDSERRRRDLVAKGARMQGLNRAAEALLQSATRLEKDVRRETKYWEDVLSVSQNGWSLRRMPRQASTLGVQVVSAEGTCPLFWALGHGLIRRCSKRAISQKGFHTSAYERPG